MHTVSGKWEWTWVVTTDRSVYVLWDSADIPEYSRYGVGHDIKLTSWDSSCKLAVL